MDSETAAQMHTGCLSKKVYISYLSMCTIDGRRSYAAIKTVSGELFYYKDKFTVKY